LRTIFHLPFVAFSNKHSFFKLIAVVLSQKTRGEGDGKRTGEGMEGLEEDVGGKGEGGRAGKEGEGEWKGKSRPMIISRSRRLWHRNLAKFSCIKVRFKIMKVLVYTLARNTAAFYSVQKIKFVQEKNLYKKLVSLSDVQVSHACVSEVYSLKHPSPPQIWNHIHVECNYCYQRLTIT